MRLLQNILLLASLMLGMVIMSSSQSGVGGGQSGVGGGSGVSQSIFCGTTVACAGTSQSGTKIIYGSAPLSTGTPSTAVITGLPFTSSASYRCSVSDQTAVISALYFITYNSGTSFTITGGTALTDNLSFICVGI